MVNKKAPTLVNEEFDNKENTIAKMCIALDDLRL